MRSAAIACALVGGIIRHMTAEVTTVKKDGSLKLPKKARGAWKGARVYVDVSGNTALVTRIEQSTLSLSDMADEFKKAARTTKRTRADVLKVIRSVRRSREW